MSVMAGEHPQEDRIDARNQQILLLSLFRVGDRRNILYLIDFFEVQIRRTRLIFQ